MSLQNNCELKRTALKKYFGRMNPQQQEAVFTVNGPVLVLAGAGSGKTTVIVNRIANMVNFGDAYYNETASFNEDDAAFLRAYVNGETDDLDRLKKITAVSPIRPYNILAITFTNKAAGELKERLSSMLGDCAQDIHAATFHSACVRMLRRDIDRLGYSKSFTIYDSDDSQRIIKACLTEMNLSEKQLPPKALLSEISSAKDSLISPSDMLRDVDGDYRKTAVAKIYAEYQKRLFASSAVDFDDIITLTVRLLTDFDDVREYYLNRYKYVMVDEYQDTNHAQYKLVSLLAQGHKNLCVVGDDDQSIYKFRGATIENILSFENQFENCKTIRLEQNYRSTQNILSAANSVIKNNAGRKPKELWTDSTDGDKIVLYKASDELDEAKFVASKILECIKNGGKYNDNAILYRMNAQSNILERAFVQSGIPYKVFGGMKFYDRKEIKDIIAYLSVINNNNDLLRLKRIINEPKRGIGDTTIEMLDDVVRDLNLSAIEIMRNASEYPVLSKKAPTLRALAKIFDSLGELADTVPLDEFLDTVMDKSGYRDYLVSLGDEGVGRLENINELKSTMLDYSQATENPTLAEFLEEISLYTDIDKLDTDADFAVMMTMHSAKGLEFPNVFVVGMEDGIFPSARSMYSDDDLEEERRLAYVAITRARKKLYLTSAAQRMLFGSTNRNSTSRFVKEIDSSLIEKTENVKTVKNVASKAPNTVSSMSLQQQIAQNKIKPAVHAENIKFNAGDAVSHSIFGKGTVISVREMANDAMLEIAFEKVGTKKVMAKFAKIKKI